MNVYIGNLPKEILLYNLWKNAKYLHFFNIIGKKYRPILTIKIACEDIGMMIKNNRRLELAGYYGKNLNIDISGDYLDLYEYELSNGSGIIRKVIRKLKKKEMKKTITKFYLF